MAILTLNDTPPPSAAHAFRTQEELKTSTIFDKELDIAKVQYQVSGLKWTVDYFNQILGVNSQPLAPDINIPETTLKYNRIDKLDIFVDSGLPASPVIDITGTGTINAGFVPFLGDAFTATLAGGRIGIFVLTAVRKEYYNTHPIYTIDYKLLYFADTSAASYNDLVYKTVRTYVYDKNAIDSFSVPVLLASDYKKRIDLAKAPIKIAKQYIKLFLDSNTKLFRLPTTISTYVDQLVGNAVLKLVSVSEVPEVANVNRSDKEVNSVTIWDALLTRDVTLLDAANYNINYSMHTTARVASSKLLSYLGVQYIMTDVANAPISNPAATVNPLAARKVVTDPISGARDGYIFSKSFYVQDTSVPLTDFETIVMEYLRGEIPNRTIATNLLTEYEYWSTEDQYLLLPILLLIIKTLVSNTYSSI